jgi:hypothetical protein
MLLTGLVSLMKRHLSGFGSKNHLNDEPYKYKDEK